VTGSWRAFVPNRLVRLLHAHPEETPVGLVDRGHSVVLFADLAGFTPMTEAHASAGRYGAEEVRQVLSQCFQRMGEVVAGYGGDIVQFAGDAMTVVWDAEDPTVLHRHAVDCASAMQSAVAGFHIVGTSVGTFPVAMRIGIAAGPIVGAVVGDPASRLQYVLLGKAVDGAATAAQRAPKGGVAVDASVMVDDEWIDPEPSDGIRLLRSLSSFPAAPPMPSTGDSWPQLPDKAVARFLHPAVAERLHAGRRELLNEHRTVTVVFVGLPPIGPGAEDITRLQGLVQRSIQLLDRYEGNLQRVGTGDKGTLLLIWFGAPLAHEDDEERAIRCCLDLLSLRDQPLRAAITTGLVLWGEIGSEARREYTALGVAVNLAARLMQAASPGQLLVDAATFKRVAGTAIGDRLEPFTVKGRMEPVLAWGVRSIRDQPALPLHEPVSSVPLIGRHAETRHLRQAVELAAAGKGQVVCLVGEAGVGKSRLVAEVAGLARQAGIRAVGGACRSHATRTSYFPWRPVWAAILGVDRASSLEAQASRLTSLLSADGPEWTERAPLLASVLNLHLPDTELTASLDPEARAVLLRSLLVDRLAAETQKNPLLVVLEDCHWIDEASLALLDLVARAAEGLPLIMVITMRPAARATPVFLESAAMPHVHHLHIGELPTRDAESLAARLLRAHSGDAVDFAPEVVHQIASRAHGNPFFLEELVNFLHARGIDPNDTRGVASLDPPDSVERLILAHIDQLSEADRSILKVASVIGQRFQASWISETYPKAGSAREVTAGLDRLSTLQLVLPQSGAPELEYAFRHAITQEAVYGTLPFWLREELHAQVGAFIERTYPDAFPRWVDALAYHYSHTRNVNKQQQWFRLAADAASAAYANDAAINYYERLTGLLPEVASADVLVQLGMVYHLTGRWAEAEQAYRKAMQVAKRFNARPLLAASQRELGISLASTKSYTEAEWCLTQAAAEFRRLGDRKGLSRTLDRLAFTFYQQGDAQRALATAQEHLKVATQEDDHAGKSAALDIIGLIHKQANEYDKAQSALEAALEAAIEAADRRKIGIAANDLAGLHAQRGDHISAARYLQQALEAANEIGSRWQIAMAIHNIGELHLERGAFGEAAACYAHVLRIAVDLDDWTGMTSRVGSLATTAAEQGDLAEAEQLFNRAITLARLVESPYYLGEWLYQKARLLARMDRETEAVELNAEAQEIARRSDDPEVLWRAQLLQVLLERMLDRMDDRATLSQLHALKQAWTEPAEQAAILAAICRFDPADHTSLDIAITILRTLFTQAPKIEYRRAYERLTDETLPEPPPLPPLPDVVVRQHAELDELRERVDAGIHRLRAAAKSRREDLEGQSGGANM
jgi:predicted ATPase/class 3 adenylate cyclase